MSKRSTLWKEKFEGLALSIRWTYQSSHFLTILVLIVSVLGGLITIVEPYLFKKIIDALIGNNNFSSSESFAFGILGILIIYGVARMIQSIFWDVTSMIRRVHALRIEREVMHSLMANVSSLDLVYFEDPKYYNTLSRATGNIWRIVEVFWQLTFLIGEIVSIIVIVGALLVFDWRIVFIVLAGAIPSIILVMKTAEVQWSGFTAASPIFRHAQYYRSLLTESPEAIKEIKSFGLRDFFLKKFKGLFNGFIHSQDSAAKKQLKWYIIVSIVEGGLSVFAAWLVVQSYIQKEISIGDVTFLWALLFQFASHVRWMVRLLGEANIHATFITPIVKTLHFSPSIKSPERPERFPPTLRSGIELKNVSFKYRRAKKFTLKNISLHVKPGESIALVGENGSGKTTLVKILCRLYDATRGNVLIDGKDIKKYSLKDISEHIGIIFQDFMKYEALIEENIGYGHILHNKKKGRIVDAAKKSGALDFIKELDKKFKTQIGKKIKDDGIELSGGQWQKVALARAFFKDAQILILDEPTAAVDARAEYALFKRFQHISKNKTTFLISHRFSTVRMADRIIVLEKGMIAEEGSHEQLLKKNGIYAKLFKLQAKGYK